MVFVKRSVLSFNPLCFSWFLFLMGFVNFERIIVMFCLMGLQKNLNAPLRLAFLFFGKKFMTASVVLFNCSYIEVYSICSLLLMLPECGLKIGFLWFCL